MSVPLTTKLMEAERVKRGHQNVGIRSTGFSQEEEPLIGEFSLFDTVVPGLRGRPVCATRKSTN